MLSISPLEMVEQLITVFSQRLQPLALQRLSVADILQDAAALAIIEVEIPSIDDFRVMKQQRSCFGRLLKFLHLHEPTGYERDEEHKRTAVRYLALRTMLHQCSEIKISTIQEACLDKVLRWFEATEAHAFVSATASTPILPPRMSPMKSRMPPTQALDKCPSEMSFSSTTTAVSNATVAAKLEKYKMPDLRASHIRRIAELRSHGADISYKALPIEEDDNHLDRKPQGIDFQIKREQNRMIEATFKLYHPETDAEREMNLLWIRRRQEEETKRKKDEEVQQRVQKWAMDRSRDESENLRKRESTKLVAGLGQILQEGVDQEKPFAWRSTIALHSDLAGMANQSNQPVAVKGGVAATKEAKEFLQQAEAATRKPSLQTHTKSKQPAQIVIKSRKPTAVSSGGGMHFRNQLPPNYAPPGLSSVPKTKREVSSATLNTRSLNSKDRFGSRGSFERRASGVSDDASSASEEEEEDPATDDSVNRKRRSVSREIGHQMKLQSYHVPYYYTDGTDHNASMKASAFQKPYLRGTLPVQPLPADPEFRCLQEANAMRRVFAIPSEKKPNSVSSTGREVSSSQKSARSDAQSGSKTAKGKRNPTSSRSGVVLSRTASAELQCTASTSDLRQSQMEELEKIRRLFEENNLSFSPQVLERGLLVPEDRPLLESITNLPFPGSRLLSNPLTRRSKPTKAKKKPGTKKKKTKKGKKGTKAPKSSRK